MKKLNVLSLFDGISCGKIAIEKSGIGIENYYASEIDLNAIKISKKNNPDIIHLGDVTMLDSDKFSKIDLLLGGSPCQDLSNLKLGDGLAGDKSKLLLDYVRLKNELNPRYFILENVVPRKKEWKDQIDELMGVKGIMINSDLFVPQNRPRIYWTNIPIAILPERPNWNKNYFQWRRTYFRKNMSGVCPCLTANMGTGGHNVPLKSMDLKDKLTPEECEYLQGIPDGYTSGVANSHRYKSIGNGWTIDVISHILSGIKLNQSQTKLF